MPLPPGLLAQAENAADDPDLTVPIVVIVVCAVLIVVTLILQRVRSQRARRVATPEELSAWQLEGGRLLDQWTSEVEAEVQARRTSPTPEAVTRNDDPPGLQRAIDECPDARLAAVVGELRQAGAALLAAVREGDPHGPKAAAAEARFQEVKGRAALFLGPSRPTAFPQ
ncbi:MAG TPA: hypothetical protein VD926_10585 [Acidimicrobiales bacterium]|nr:hypothetical protein [Acidimicrobiales bacterium]